MNENFIKELVADKNFDYIYLWITEVRTVREYTYGDETKKVLDITVKDKNEDTIHLTLWGPQVDLHKIIPFEVNDKIIIVGGYCRLYNGSKQISTGKIGVISKVKDEVKVVSNKKKGKVKA